MHVNTGQLYEGTPQEIRSIERKLQTKLVRVPLRDSVKVKEMNQSQRKSYAKQLRKRKARAAQARKSRKANR